VEIARVLEIKDVLPVCLGPKRKQDFFLRIDKRSSFLSINIIAP
jgi:hypothetical protein